jgi:hypothetical protein
MSIYTDQQIKDFIQQQGIADNPHAIYNFAQQYGVSPGDIDRVLGAQAGASDKWIASQGLKGLDGSAYGGTARSAAPVTDEQIRQFIAQQGIADNPHAIQAFAQQYGVSPAQVDSALGAKAGQSAAWQQAQGLSTAGGQPANPYAPGAGPGGMTLAPNPVGGYNTYTPPAATTQQATVPGAQQPNPYLPVTGSSTQPVAGGYNSYNGQSMPQGQPRQQTQGQAPQGGNPYLQGGGMAMDNPYTSWMADSIGQKLGQNLQRNILPGIRSAASQAGGLGGSRQGIAEGVAIGDTMSGYGQALAGLYSGQHNQDRQYGLASDALDLNVYNSNQDWMRKGQQDQIGFANQMLGWNQAGLNTATQAQQTPFNNWNQFVQPAVSIGGMGGQNTQNMQGNPYLGALGGAMTGYNLYNNWNKGS